MCFGIDFVLWFYSSKLKLCGPMVCCFVLLFIINILNKCKNPERIVKWTFMHLLLSYRNYWFMANRVSSIFPPSPTCPILRIFWTNCRHHLLLSVNISVPMSPKEREPFKHTTMLTRHLQNKNFSFFFAFF